ncbi:hypothetical protein GSI_07975 [Ganoderma sinense ZZ0214-1]|uniref:DUF6593 domain-containing protein n=1 Tax=Ganoderma sinense ZZ0214-1 TaxID=1077348 RepID=A0A2G8S7L5_9APHY|nr:hypothetical protein GSI_07975 [Ganoderma sinense ZZ0214-1]
MSSPAATATLTLTPDNVSNAAIYDVSGEALYTISTQLGWLTSTTQVKNVDGEVVAMLEWRDVLPNRLTLGKRPPTSLHDWLQTSRVPYSARGNASFKDDSGRKYRWKGTTYSKTLELFAEDDDYKVPIATFKRSRLSLGEDLPAEPASLVLTERAVEIQDAVVISFLFLEKLRRGKVLAKEQFSNAPPIGTRSLLGLSGA